MSSKMKASEYVLTRANEKVSSIHATKRAIKIKG